jgi:transcriptional regulator with XRE-family HTH domain
MTTDLILTERKSVGPYTQNSNEVLPMVPIERNLTLQGKLEKLRKTLPYKIEYAKDTFSDELWQAMQIRGLSQVRFAKKAKVSKQFLTKIFKGENCTIETMVRLADALNYKLNIHLTPVDVSCEWIHWSPQSFPRVSDNNVWFCFNTRYKPVTKTEKALETAYAAIPSNS